MKTIPSKSDFPGPPRVVLLETLREVARMLGRTPTMKDWRALPDNAKRLSVDQYVARFGSWVNALRAAGLPLNRSQEFSKQELIEQLRNLSKALGRKLKPADVSAAAKRHTCAKERTFFVAFGTVPLALKAAGVYSARVRIPEEKMLADLRDLAASLEHPIRGSDIESANKRGKCASLSVYHTRFGSFSGAVRAAGLEYIPQAISREELLDYLHRLHAELGRIPTYPDVQEKAALGLMPTMMNYSKKFGGIHGALIEAGIEKPKPTIDELKQKMLADLRELTERLGHAPLQPEWKAAAKEGVIASPTKYLKVFGSVDQARREAGVIDQLMVLPRLKYGPAGRPSRGEITAHLVELARELGRVPGKSEVDQAARSNTRFSYSTICRVCYSLELALDDAGLLKHRRRKRKFDREVMITQLQEYVRKKGRTPKRSEWNAARDPKVAPGYEAYEREFGNWNQAMLAAGIKPLSPSDRVRQFDDEKLLDDLRKLAAKLGHRPKVRELKAASLKGKCASVPTYHKRFGGHLRALEAAGLAS